MIEDVHCQDEEKDALFDCIQADDATIRQFYIDEGRMRLDGRHTVSFMNSGNANVRTLFPYPGIAAMTDALSTEHDPMEILALNVQANARIQKIQDEQGFRFIEQKRKMNGIDQRFIELARIHDGQKTTREDVWMLVRSLAGDHILEKRAHFSPLVDDILSGVANGKMNEEVRSLFGHVFHDITVVQDTLFYKTRSAGGRISSSSVEQQLITAQELLEYRRILSGILASQVLADGNASASVL